MCLILPQIISIKSHNYTRKYYTEKGYNVGCVGEEFNIHILDLPNSSTQKVKVQCDFCGKIYEIEYRKYILQNTGGTSCSDCRYNKVEATNMVKYGNKCSLRNKEVLSKSKQTNMKKYGVEYPFQNKEILQKTIDAQIKKYGGVGRAINTSSQQKYLHSLYGGELNFYIAPYHADILFEEEKIVFEYDGLGHDMLVKLGKLTREEFEEKEKLRSGYLQNLGYKEFHIIADKKDKLPNNEYLLKIKDMAFDYLINQNGTYYSYNLYTKEIITF